MENFSYYSPTLFEFGRGAEEKTGMLTFLTGAGKVMIVYGKSYAKNNGLIDRIENSLNTIGIDYVEFGGVLPNPTDTLIYEGIEKARAAHIDGLVAVGGGSVIDTAKAIAAGVPYKGDFKDFFIGKKQLTEALPVGVVLTIPGAGSEGSGNCVITFLEENRKVYLRTDSILRPRFAVINPEMTFTLTARQTAEGVLDMTGNALERYFSPSQRVELTDRVIEGVLSALMSESPKALADPTDYHARANIEWAGTIAQNGVLGCGRNEDGACHAIVREICAMYPEISHGEALAITIPAWMGFMAHHKPSKLAMLGRRIFGVDEKDDRTAAIETVASFQAFFKAILRMPGNFGEAGIGEPDIDKLVEHLHANNGEFTGAYYKLSPKDSRQIFELMLSAEQRQAQIARAEAETPEPAAPAV